MAWYRRSFERVLAESRRTRRLIEDLAWLARFDSMQQPPPGESVDLGVLAEQAADRFTVVAETKAQQLEVEIASPGATLSAPPEWLDQLIGVLLDNACKYSPQGGSVRLTVEEAGTRVMLTVDDSGPGIPEARRDSIFDRFHRDADGTDGAGLGLAIAHVGRLVRPAS